MQITHFDIRNFRKLERCRVELSNEKTIFVGANNSGKTSAMDALILFLKNSRRKDLATTDITLSNWHDIDKIGQDWIDCSKTKTEPNFSRSLWAEQMPAVDVWFCISDEKLHYVRHIIPTLTWSGDAIGIRLILEPKDIEKLHKDFKIAFDSKEKTLKSRKAHQNQLPLWPKSMKEFLEKNLHDYFGVHAYILDPTKIDNICQSIPDEWEPLDGDPFKGLFKIDIINAQRGFFDPNTSGGTLNDKRLTAQLRDYFNKHLDPNKSPEPEDIEALDAINTAQTAFDDKLKAKFKKSIDELESINYPGFTNPKLTLTSRLNPLDGLKHDAAIQYQVPQKDASEDTQFLRLPEIYNGLGYQNLISMIFRLIGFRDEWMRIGKVDKEKTEDDSFFELLHLVLIEEPEAHLHAQVQQVFIRKAYDVLRNSENLQQRTQFRTQMIVSTHSSHIAHEVDFTDLRYFRRTFNDGACKIPCATVVNMKNTFGTDSETQKFASRYLKTTHCDLFFADAVIFVEGSAERMLVPHFIKHQFPDLDKCYISLLEIGGSHAHKLKPLIEALSLTTLILTDIDSIDPGENRKKKRPEENKGYITANPTLKEWLPRKSSLDELVNATVQEKESVDPHIRIEYQQSFHVGGCQDKVIPSTFEDALVLENIEFFRTIQSPDGLLKKMVVAVQEPFKLSQACSKMFDALRDSKKAEMALDLLWATEPCELKPPSYIKNGLTWLQGKLGKSAQEAS